MNNVSYKDIRFVLVGPPKTGTTWLRACVDENEEVFCPRETTFFSYGESGSSFRRQNDSVDRVKWEPWEKRYLEAQKNQVLGDYGASYSVLPHVPELLARLNSEVKIIFTVRDPVRRAVSNYKHDVRMGLIPRRVSLEHLISPQFFGYRYIGVGHYSEHIARYLEYFDVRQIYVSPMPRKEKDNQPLLDRVFEFLEVEPMTIELANQQVYESRRPLWPRWHYRAHFGGGWR